MPFVSEIFRVYITLTLNTVDTNHCCCCVRIHFFPFSSFERDDVLLSVHQVHHILFVPTLLLLLLLCCCAHSRRCTYLLVARCVILEKIVFIRPSRAAGYISLSTKKKKKKKLATGRVFDMSGLRSMMNIHLCGTIQTMENIIPWIYGRDIAN
uniref:Uncharacterized protein n=1 Tax=Sipha flava TaxID=143950 RepID=A0A2S2QN27_9HEMI